MVFDSNGRVENDPYREQKLAWSGPLSPARPNDRELVET
jgi:hypothetical protein